MRTFESILLVALTFMSLPAFAQERTGADVIVEPLTDHEFEAAVRDMQRHDELELRRAFWESIPNDPRVFETVEVVTEPLGLENVIIESSDNLLVIFSSQSCGFHLGVLPRLLASPHFRNAIGVTRYVVFNPTTYPVAPLSEAAFYMSPTFVWYQKGRLVGWLEGFNPQDMEGLLEFIDTHNRTHVR